MQIFIMNSICAIFSLITQKRKRKLRLVCSFLLQWRKQKFCLFPSALGSTQIPFVREICGIKFGDAGTEPEAEAVLVQGPALECRAGVQTSTAAQIWAISAHESSAAPSVPQEIWFCSAGMSWSCARALLAPCSP